VRTIKEIREDIDRVLDAMQPLTEQKVRLVGELKETEAKVAFIRWQATNPHASDEEKAALLHEATHYGGT